MSENLRSEYLLSVGPKHELFVFLIDPHMFFFLNPTFPINLSPPVTCDLLANPRMRRVQPSEPTTTPTQPRLSRIPLSGRAEWDAFRWLPEDLKDPSVSALHEPDYWVRISIKGHRAQFNDCYALNSLLVVSPGKPCALYTTLRTISQLFPSTAISFSCVCL